MKAISWWCVLATAALGGPASAGAFSLVSSEFSVDFSAFGVSGTLPIAGPSGSVFHRVTAPSGKGYAEFRVGWTFDLSSTAWPGWLIDLSVVESDPLHESPESTLSAGWKADWFTGPGGIDIPLTAWLGAGYGAVGTVGAGPGSFARGECDIEYEQFFSGSWFNTDRFEFGFDASTPGDFDVLQTDGDFQDLSTIDNYGFRAIGAATLSANNDDGPSSASMTVDIPTPGTIWTLAALGVMGSRRRR